MPHTTGDVVGDALWSGSAPNAQDQRALLSMQRPVVVAIEADVPVLVARFVLLADDGGAFDAAPQVLDVHRF
jgi:hypothetical protein